MDGFDLIVLAVFFVFLVLLVVVWAFRRGSSNTRRVRGFTDNEQMDIDLRLTCKRYKELYPWSKLTYQEYKQMQMEKAFKRAVSAEKNKRMVR